MQSVLGIKLPLNHSIFIMLFMWFGLTSNCFANDLQQLLENTIAVYGGEETLRKTRGIYQTGTTFSQRRGVSGKVERYYIHPDNFRIDIYYPGTTPEQRIVSGTYAWKHGRPVSVPSRLAMILQAVRIGLPMILLEHREHVLDQGVVTGGEKPLHGIEIPLAEGLRVIAEIDPESGYIHKSTRVMNIAGQRMEFATAYSDFRYQQGRLVAFREEHLMMGGRAGYTQLDKVEFVQQFPSDTFMPAPPSGI